MAEGSDKFDRITVEPGKCAGKPCIRGMRITVRRVLELLATYRDRDEVLREYPFLEDEDLSQALRFGAASVDQDLVDLKPVA
jgi:uncharacterized protein (DUF433 family)